MWPKWLTLAFYQGLWNDFIEFMSDLPLKALKGVLEAVAGVFEQVTPPDFLSQHSLAATMGPVMNDIGFFLAQSGLSTALGIIVGAIMFRVVRKVVTFGLW